MSKKARRIKVYMKMGIILLTMLMVFLGGVKLYKNIFGEKYVENKGSQIEQGSPLIDVQLLDVNEYSRPGNKSNKIKSIVMHYTANPGSTASQNRDYFNGLKDSHETKASSHFVIGLEGEIVQCIPTWEEAYASNDRNLDSVSIECCHLKADGKFNDNTYKSMVELAAWLCKKFDLNESDVIRHYDITGKVCPKYFVDDEKAWKRFQADIKKELK